MKANLSIIKASGSWDLVRLVWPLGHLLTYKREVENVRLAPLSPLLAILAARKIYQSNPIRAFYTSSQAYDASCEQKQDKKTNHVGRCQ